eukprot:sb/3466696/
MSEKIGAPVPPPPYAANVGPPQQGYPPQQYPPTQQYPAQQYPPTQQYPAQQYPPTQQYPPQQYPPAAGQNVVVVSCYVLTPFYKIFKIQFTHVCKLVTQATGPAPQSNQILAWISCLFFCCPIGLLAGIKANRAENLIREGRLEEARIMGEAAKKLAITAIICGIITAVISGVIQVIVVVASAGMTKPYNSYNSWDNDCCKLSTHYVCKLVTQATGPAPQSNQILAWISCLFFCCPIGLLAGIKANRAENLIREGRLEEARIMGEAAKKLAITAIICGIITAVISGVIQVIVVVASAGMTKPYNSYNSWDNDCSGQHTPELKLKSKF